MQRPAGPSIRHRRETLDAPDEVERVRRLHLASLRRRIREGTYFTPARVRTAIERMVLALRD